MMADAPSLPDAARPAKRLKSGDVVAQVPRLSLNIEEACASLGVSWDVFHEQIEPEIRIVRIGRRKLVPVAELERWLTAHAESLLERR